MTLEENIVLPTKLPFTCISKLDNILSGRYLSLEDNIFVENVVADIRNFLSREEENRKSVLIFPPVNNYRRFLIHKVCEENLSKELSTFSVGQGFNRRTVVCFKGLVRNPSISNKSHDQPSQHVGDQTCGTMVVERQPLSSESSSPEHQCQNGSVRRVRAAPAIYRPPAARKLEALSSQVKQNTSVISAVATTQVMPVSSKSERTRSGTRQRRPDLQVYVPRAKRASMMDQSVPERHIEHDEIPVSHQMLCEINKNVLEQPSKIQNASANTNHDKSCQILHVPVLNDSNKRNISKKMEVDYSVKRENPGDIQTEDCIVNESSKKCSSGSIISDSDKISIPVGCETEELLGTPERNYKNNETVNSESQDVDLSSSTDLNENNCVSDLCNKRNYDEKVALSDSENNVNVVFVKDFNTLGDEKVQLEDDDKYKDHNNEFSSEIKDSVNSYNCVPLQEDAVVMQRESNEKSICSGNREKENKNNKKIVRENFISDVLVISDPEPLSESVCTKAKAEDLEKNITNSKKTKVKHKSDITSSEKNENIMAPTTAPIVSLNPDECTWDMLFDDNGDCLDPKIMEELTSAVGSVTIEKPQSDYNRFISRPEINLPGGDDEFAHVVEIYNFPPEFKTQDLLSVFSPYKNGGFEIKWVDDTHALGVFSSSRVAADVLAYDHPFVKTRPLSEATPESRVKARRSSEFLQPYRARPETCVAMARRLVTGALGMRVSTSREEREAERRLLKEAREKKRLAAQQQQDAWEGTIR